MYQPTVKSSNFTEIRVYGRPQIRTCLANREQVEFTPCFFSLNRSCMALKVLLNITNYEQHDMKADIHPKYTDVNVKCSCGNAFTTRSTYGRDDMTIDVCSECHPFYTGKQKILDSAGQIDKFNKRFGNK